MTTIEVIEKTVNRIVRVNNETKEHEGEHTVYDLSDFDTIKIALKWAMSLDQCYDVYVDSDTDTERSYSIVPDHIIRNLIYSYEFD